ncbi:alpha/beta hydrolase [Pantoea sp. KPR_PJ]|uniref:alpha/beta hydrolase n=1 Tax=Pantoea sp. KPR_PJ TaxID=2738375 RepID=UPI0035279AA0
MRSLTLVPLIKKTVTVVILLALCFFIGRIYQAEQGAPLHRWHSWHADEMSPDEIDHASFADYLLREEAIFRDMKISLNDRLDAAEKTAMNRYSAQSRVYPARFTPDWNRSFILRPDKKPVGVAILLHGLTDSPYSLRDFAENYRQQGFIAVVPRLPGHGTAPGSLTAISWQSWMATTRLAVREATQLAGRTLPLHMVGYSNGGALAIKYAMDSLEDSTLTRPQQIVLLSPMIGVNGYARFAGLAGWPAWLPAFARTAWLTVLPEYNPFKYNSFPVNAARQSWQLTQAVQSQIDQLSRRKKLAALPPVLTFQSITDATVSTSAVVNALYHYLPVNGSKLVLFDINHAVTISALFRNALPGAVDRLLPPAPRHYDTVILSNETPGTLRVAARVTAAGEVSEKVQPLALSWPQNMFSLSHIAVPFPLNDSLYGLYPAEAERFGISLGAMGLRGESGSLDAGTEAFMRATSNPFFDDMMARVNQQIACRDRADYVACVRALP